MPNIVNKIYAFKVNGNSVYLRFNPQLKKKQAMNIGCGCVQLPFHLRAVIHLICSVYLSAVLPFLGYYFMLIV